MKPRTTTAVLPQPGSLVALLALRAELPQLPAATWPIEGALEVLGGQARSDGPVRAALNQLPQGPLGPDQRVAGVRQLLRALVASGRLVPEGAGWDARFTVDDTWLRAHTQLYDMLPSDDQAAVDFAAQRLTAMATMLSKKSAA